MIWAINQGVLRVGQERAYLDNFIPREGQKRDVCGVACHQVSIEDTQNTFVGDD
jgi:hypothetical protein